MKSLTALAIATVVSAVKLEVKDVSQATIDELYAMIESVAS